MNKILKTTRKALGFGQISLKNVQINLVIFLKIVKSGLTTIWNSPF